MILWANLSNDNPVKLNIRSGKENLHKHEKHGEKGRVEIAKEIWGDSRMMFHPIQKQNLHKLGN
jgi:stress response protein YsnF